MRLVLFLLVLACTLRADSIPITGSINEALYGHLDATISGPGLSFSISDPTDCLYCGDPGVGDCLPGTICAFNYGFDLQVDTLDFNTFAGATYNGVSVESGMCGFRGMAITVPNYNRKTDRLQFGILIGIKSD